MGNSNGRKKSSGGASRSPSPVVHAKSEQPGQKRLQGRDKPDPLATDQSLLGRSGIHLPKPSGKRKPDRSRSAPASQKPLPQYAPVEAFSPATAQPGLQARHWTDQTPGYNLPPEKDPQRLQVYIYLDTAKPIKVVAKDPAASSADWIRERFFEKVRKLKVDFQPFSSLQ